MKVLTAVTRLLAARDTIHSSALSASQKRRVFRTYFRTFFFKRYDREGPRANVAGYKVSFCSYQALSTLFVEIFLNQEYFFSPRSSKPVIFDCGSNIGMAMLYFHFLDPRAEITCFEPDPRTFSCLQQNIRNNNLSAVQCHNAALLDRKGEVRFFHDDALPGSLHMSTVEERMPKQSLMVKATVLSRHITKPVDCLKLDVEGAEQAIISELIASGKIQLIDNMIIEYHHHIDAEQDSFSEFLRLLEDAGFGYQIEGKNKRPLAPRLYQDILIYAYRKQ